MILHNNHCFLIGLTGQTGAGKTTVSRLFAENGIAVINADTVAREVVQPGHPCLQALTKVCGNVILQPNGQLDRKATAALIFGNPDMKQRYLAVMYPYITAAVREQIAALTAAGQSFIMLDAPTLFESGLDRFCNAIVSVTADAATRKARIISRDALTAQQAEQRMNAQHTEAFFRAHSDAVIENNGDQDALHESVIKVLENLRCQAQPDTQNTDISKEEPVMEQKDTLKQLKESLLMQKKNAALLLDDDKIAECDAFCEGYKTFLDRGKTEREACAYAKELLEAKGFRAWKRGDAVKAGDKIYKLNRNKAIVAAVIGTDPLESGIRLSAAHIDSPRLDLKQQPLYEDNELALFKTHYYGGIKKYQWTVLPMALHGVVVKKDGTSVTVSVGEDAGDPVFCVTDLLPHLASEQVKRPLAQGIKGEASRLKNS